MFKLVRYGAEGHKGSRRVLEGLYKDSSRVVEG